MRMNGNESMGMKNLISASVFRTDRGRRLAWSRLRDLGSRDPGSNPGDPTMITAASTTVFSIHSWSMYSGVTLGVGVCVGCF